MKYKIYIFITILLLSGKLSSQDYFKRKIPKSVITSQYAGSTGFLSFGYSILMLHDKLELGLLYGKVPKQFGGVNRSLTLKGIYTPFKIPLTEKIDFEPIQAGLFISQNFNENLGLTWGKEYSKGYYWWTRSLRFHAFFSSQVSYKLKNKHFNKIGCYLEANTNDLYVFSYLPNSRVLKLYDIISFGTGIKLYLR